jgi:hypothetical protein
MIHLLRRPKTMPTPSVLFGLNPLILSSVLLLLVYAALIADTINRAIVSLLGACAMIVSGILTQDMATQSIDANTIGLLTGMMILVSISRRSGILILGTRGRFVVWNRHLCRRIPPSFTTRSSTSRMTISR